MSVSGVRIAILALVLSVGTSEAGPGKIIYVDADATGANDGSSWADAFVFLRNGISAAEAGDQMWVAEGTYRPDDKTCLSDPDCIEAGVTGTCVDGVCAWTIDPRTMSIRLISAIYGGFDGTETKLDQRNAEVNVTVLSGDLLGDDSSVSCTNDAPDCDGFGEHCIDGTCILNDNVSDNSAHVVVASSITPDGVLDGFTVAGGHAIEFGFGGGILLTTGGIDIENTIRDCIVRGNFATFRGGGLYSGAGSGSLSNPLISNCSFIRNASGEAGGGLFYSGPSPDPTAGRGLIENCTLEHNVVLDLPTGNPFKNGGGAGIGGPVDIANCTFTGNIAEVGGGAVLGNASGTVSDCDFTDNPSELTSSVYVESSTGLAPTFINCTIIESDTGNAAGSVPPAGDSSGEPFGPPDTTAIFGPLAVAIAPPITVTGLMTVGLNGSYQPLPGAANVSAGISTASALITNSLAVAPEAFCPPSCGQPTLRLEDQMILTASGNVVLDGSDTSEPLALGTTIPPPLLIVADNATLIVGGSLEIIDDVSVVIDSNNAVELAGSFVNGGINPQAFDWDAGRILMQGKVAQAFEAAGLDLGPVTNGLDSNFGVGTLELAEGTTVQIVDNFNNQTPETGACDEVLYVNNLIVGPGDLHTSCIVYYNQLTNNGSIPGLRIDVLEICGPIADLDCNGAINAADLAVLLGSWGPNPGHPADFNNDNMVNATDLALLLGNWG